MTRRAIVGILGAWVAVSAAPAADVKDFYKSWAEVQKASRQQNKPIYLHFTTTWCGWCRKIEQETYTNVAGDAALKDYVAASLDCTDEGANDRLMKELGGDGYPYLVMLMPDKAVLNTIGGYLPPKEFAKELAKGKRLYDELQVAEKELAQRPQDIEANLACMRVYAKVKLWSKARQLAETVLSKDPQNAGKHAAEAYVVVLQAMVAKAPVLPTSRPAKAMPPDKLLDEIRKLDPKSEQGMLEEALGTLAESELGKLPSRPPYDPEAMAHCRKALGYVRQMTAPGMKLKQTQDAYLIMFQCHRVLNERPQALAALEKAYLADTDSEIAPRLKEVLEKLKANQ